MSTKKTVTPMTLLRVTPTVQRHHKVVDRFTRPLYNGKDNVDAGPQCGVGTRAQMGGHLARSFGGSVQLNNTVMSGSVPRGAGKSPMLLQGRQGTEPAQFLVRGPLAGRAHKLLGLGPVGSAHLGQRIPSMMTAFGGDALTYHRLAGPWISARSLARAADAMPTQSSIGWLLGQKR